jgi:hypothetical protein
MSGHLIVLDFTTLLILEDKLLSSLLCKFSPAFGFFLPVRFRYSHQLLFSDWMLKRIFSQITGILKHF